MLLGAENSPIQDKLCMYQITINGQLFLLMLTEILELEDAVILYQNTDGIMIRYHKSIHDKINNLIDSFQEFLGIVLEIVPMKSVFMENGSSYLAITESKKIKRKGAFKKREDKGLSEDSSSNIVAIALENYFVNGIPIKETIMNHDNIFDFYIGMKKQSGITSHYEHIIVENEQQSSVIYKDKVIRFYASTRPKSLIKVYRSGKFERVLLGRNTEMAQEHLSLSMKEYDIDYNYYIYEAQKIIDKITVVVSSLF